jgi:hypothetical protein
LNASQLVTFAVEKITSGMSVTGNKPFAAFSGNMLGYLTPLWNNDYMMVLL